jgi:hypothetical protein
MKKSFTVVTLMCLITFISLTPIANAQETTADDMFITLFIPGYNDSKTDGMDPNAAIEPQNPYNVMFKSWQTLIDEDWRNVSSYAFSYGDSKADYSAMSDIILEELGDFNSGLQYFINPTDMKAPPDDPPPAASASSRQPMLTMAKTEWVYRKLKGVFPDLIDENFILRKYLLLGPRFRDFLVAKDMDSDGVADDFSYIEQKFIETGFIALPTDETEKKAFLKAVYDAANACPDTFRFVVHSMGGEFTLRYLTEDESSPFGFYKRYRNYTREKFDAEAVLPQYQEIRAAVADDDILYQIFKKERENIVEEVVALDSPLPGSPTTRGA